LPSVLAECRCADDVQAHLGEMSSPSPSGRLPAARHWINRCYGSNEVEHIVGRLRAESADAAGAALADILTKSPTSLKVALRNVRSAVSFNSVEESFQQDYRIALACIAGHDFIEGIRATIVDKDRNPAWQPDRLKDRNPAW